MRGVGAVAMLLLVAVLAAACGRSATPTGRRDGQATSSKTTPGATDSDGGDGGQAAKTGSDGSAAGDAGAAKGVAVGIRGRVVTLEKVPNAKVLIYRAGETSPLWAGNADGEGRFEAPDQGPGSYRIILPGDGVHCTADLYATVAPDAGPPELVINRSAGCPARITVRAPDGEVIPRARIEVTVPELTQVPDEHRPRVEATGDDEGVVVIKGTCVRGPMTGTVHAPGHPPHDFQHGFFGNGLDAFDINLPGPPDAGVAGDAGAAPDATVAPGAGGTGGGTKAPPSSY